MRRMLARRTRRVFADVWPIRQSAGRRPTGWPGWPEGNKFAFVLTHDVEGPEGLAKTRRLMELEQELGFRSSFNFVPAGDYAVSSELREELAENGFEVGVHDLHHDGRLYLTRRSFSENAKRINHFLKEWGAKGFRSAFMMRRLDWLHDLNIEYDASTFDTDPFEPQPDGVGTIFPFWVPRPDFGIDLGSNRSSSNGGRGYVQLPYTLPQDSTLFLLLRERNPEIWLRKLDWIANHGGMALVNVHSDYLRFPGEPSSPRTFPVAHYKELLEYLQRRYAGAFWQPLPRQVAEFAKAVRVARPKITDRRVGMVAYSAYERDNRVIRYAQTLAERGDTVEVVCLKKAPTDRVTEKLGRVQVYRIGGRYKKDQKSQGQYLLPLLMFGAFASIRLAWRHLRYRYDLIHVHNMPDFLVFAALIPKLTGAKVILDIHDIMPEFYGSKFQKGDETLGTKVLKTVEGASARVADHVIISNHLWVKPFSRSAPERKCSVFINYVNQGIFYRRPVSGNGGKRVIMFPGGMQWHQGLDIAIRAMPLVLKRIPAAEFHVYGDGNRKAELIELARELGLEQSVRFFDPLPLSGIAEVMAQADLGIVPKRADSFGNEAYSTKILEFMSLGVPMVVSKTKIDQYYFNDSIVRFFESGNSVALAEAIIDVLENDEQRLSLIANALEYADLNCWSRREGEYVELVDSLIEKRPVTSNTAKTASDFENNRKNGRAPVLLQK